MKVARWHLKALAFIIALGVAGCVLLWWINAQGRDEPLQATASIVVPTPQMVERGAYLARAGNCAACHTARGGPPFAGGKGIDTPFGEVFASNITPDSLTGIGAWTELDFWRAMHHGRSKDGRLLYPVFPYPQYTRIGKDDSDALFSYLLSVQPVHQLNRPHALRFPYNTQAALAVWRAMFFSPERFEPQKEHSEEWNRGAYLVTGLGHCEACHAPRNTFGATKSNSNLSGGLIPMQNWYAPSLGSPAEAGVQDWPMEEIVQLLKSGKTAKGATLGPMAEVVFNSTQHLSESDLRAMASYLQALPRQERAEADPKVSNPDGQKIGPRLYQDACAQCHGDKGEGSGDYPPLAGNRTVTMHSSVNLVQIILSGGFPPTTEGNPRPYGMPPFRQALSDVEIAALATYVRNAWGNNAGAVMPLEVQKGR